MESQNYARARFVNIHTRARRVSTTTTLCLLIMALIVVGIGILCGTFLYRQYLQAQMHRFRGWCNIPYDSEPLVSDTDLIGNYKDNSVDSFFQEQFELDLDNEKYEKIDVPDFEMGAVEDLSMILIPT